MTEHDHPHGSPHGRDVLDGLKTPSRDLRRLIPEVYAGFVAMSAAAMTPGALDVRAKELLALAISVTKQCDGCIASHARGAAKAGATDAEVAEALGVVIMMNGGPGTVYAPRALAAFREFKAQLPDA
jgi:AhpD family alkylhydroperoxidase